MNAAAPPRTIPPRVRLDTGRPPVADELLLLALRDLGKATSPLRADLVYSSMRRTNG